jgi:hypothetical protein
MFVRWKKRACKPWVDWRGADVTHSCYLVESKRVEGKSRQKIIAYLDSIRIADDGRFHFHNNLFHDLAARALFLKWAEERLDNLGLDAGEKQCILDQIAKVVSPPSDEERRTYEEEKARDEASTAALMGRGGWR